MALQYTHLNQIQITEKEPITTSRVNGRFIQMVSNDVSIYPLNDRLPSIWECKWYNKSTIQGYKKGDAVWLNTEDVNQFIQIHKDDILNYALNNENLKYIFQDTDITDQERFSLYKDILSGFVDENGIKYEPLYYLGDITQPVQLRVCIDDNGGLGTHALPTDDNHWCDFLSVSPYEYNKKLFDDEYLNILSDQFDKHISNYHISIPQSYLSANFLRINLDNIDYQSKKAVQKPILNMSESLSRNGFDSVKFFIRKKFYNNTYKWFRLWTSGFLEHGGTINLAQPTEYESIKYQTTSDINGTSEKCYKIDLDWIFNSANKAPTYNYDMLRFENYYIGMKKFLDSENYQGEVGEYDETDNITKDKRYNIVISPLKGVKMGYGAMSTNTQTNKSFCFIPIQDCNEYSYYCSGFSITAPFETQYTFKTKKIDISINSKFKVKFVYNQTTILEIEVPYGNTIGSVISELPGSDIENFKCWSSTSNYVTKVTLDTQITSDTTCYAILDDGYMTNIDMSNSTRINISGSSFGINEAKTIKGTYVSYGD